MKDKLSPADIEVLLLCHSSCEEIPGFENEGVQEAINFFLELGAIEPGKTHSTYQGRIFRTTAAGRAWVEAMCRVPLPRAVFVDEAGRVLE